MKVQVFDKRPYECEPDECIRRVIEKLASLGRAVVAVRGTGFSANLAGTLYVGKDGDDPVLKVDGSDKGEKCDCHIHIKWGEMRYYILTREDVSYGPEPVVYLLGSDDEPVVRIFYPGKTYEDVEAALA